MSNGRSERRPILRWCCFRSTASLRARHNAGVPGHSLRSSISRLSMRSIGIAFAAGIISVCSILCCSRANAIIEGLQRGADSPAGKYAPSIFLLRASNPDRYCSATVIGPTVLLTAGHCVRSAPNEGAGSLTAANEQFEYRITCRIHPQSGASSLDIALCKTDQPLPVKRIERVENNGEALALGTPLLGFGYGCRDQLTRNFDGRLSKGYGVATGHVLGLVVVEGVAACPGDSGGGFFRETPAGLTLAGIVIGSDAGSGKILLASTVAESFSSWARNWSDEVGAGICGFSNDPFVCAPKHENLPAPSKSVNLSPERPGIHLAVPLSAPSVISARTQGVPPSVLQEIAYRKGETLASLLQITCIGTADEPYIARVLSHLNNLGTPMDRATVFIEAGTLAIPVCPPVPQAGSSEGTITIDVIRGGPTRLWDYFRRLRDTKQLSRRWHFEYREVDGSRASTAGRDSLYFVMYSRSLILLKILISLPQVRLSFL